MFKKNHPKTGSRPGTLVISEHSPLPVIRAMHYDSVDFTEERIDDVEDLTKTFDKKTFTWIDVQGFGDQAVIQRIGEIFQFHPLLLEDVVNVPQRPKSEPYEDQLLVVVRMVAPDRPDELDLEQVAIVLGENYVITFQERYGDVFDPVRERIRRKNGLISQHGVDYLCYVLIDTVVDAYFPILEYIGNQLEVLEEAVVTNPTPELLIQLNQWKNRLVNLRRVVWPHREAVNSMVRGDHPIITDRVRLFLRDTYDHCVQSSEVAEMYREMVTSLMNTYLTAVANRTNEVMRVLTIVSTVFIPITFIAGVYGMNFENMPELKMSWSYPAVWAAIILVAAAMLTYFWRKGWIGGTVASRVTREIQKTNQV